MSLHGGYQIVDFHNIPIVYNKPDGNKVPPNVFAAVSNSLGKATLVSGLVITGGTPYDDQFNPDTWVRFYENEGSEGHRSFTGVFRRTVTTYEPDPDHYVWVNSYVLSIGNDDIVNLSISSQKTVKELPIVDQEFDHESANAQSGVAIAAELYNYIPNNVDKQIFGRTRINGNLVFEGVATELNMASRKIIGLRQPVEIHEAVRKDYVDNIHTRNVTDNGNYTYCPATGALNLFGQLEDGDIPGEHCIVFDCGYRIAGNFKGLLCYDRNDVSNVCYADFVLEPTGETGTEVKLSTNEPFPFSGMTIANTTVFTVPYVNPLLERPIDNAIKADMTRKKSSTKKSNKLE